jgi:CheY-like chemotaxis protein
MGPGAVLYVEDDEMDVLFMRRAWHKAGLLNPLHVVIDGQQAEAYLSGEAPYADRTMYPLPWLVLLDLKLPKQTGLEVLGWIRQQPPPIGTLRVIVFSSSNSPRDMQQAHALGVGAYLVKAAAPQALDELVARLKAYWL